MLRDRKRSKEQLDKRPAWNNDWHKDDVEVLVNDQQYETVKLQQQCDQNMLQKEEMQGGRQGEVIEGEFTDESPSGIRRNVIDRYLQNGTTDFELNNGGNTRANSKPNPFSRNGAFKDASGSAVAKKQSSSSNEDGDNGINGDKEQTSEIVFDQNRNGAVRMPVNAPYDKYNPRKVINQKFQNNNPSLQHQHHPKEAVEANHQQTQDDDHYDRDYDHYNQKQQNDHVYIKRSNLPPPAVNRNYIQPRHLHQNHYHQQQQQYVGISGWKSNEPSPYGYQQQQRLQHQHGGGGNVMYTDSPQREQYRRDIAAEERRRIYEQNQQAMLQNKRRHEEQARRHHPSAIGHYVRATSAPLQESAMDVSVMRTGAYRRRT